MKDNSFDPGDFNAAAGAELTVMNEDNHTHTFTADDGSFDSGDIAPGKTYKLTVTDQAGDIAFHCKYHSNMKGMMKVGSGSSSGP